MEQLMERLTNEMNVLREENQTLKGDIQDLAQHGDPSASEHQESKREEGDENE